MRYLVVLLFAACGRVGFQATAAADAPEASDGRTLDTVPAVCGAAYTLLPPGGSRYRLGTTAKDWFAAEADCESDGGHLPRIDSFAENTWLVENAIPAPLVAASTWLGMADSTSEGTFVWVTGAPLTFTNWEGTEPNSTNNDEDCGQVYDNFFWNDVGCREGDLRYACECDLAPAVASYCDTETLADCGECGTPCALASCLGQTCH